MATMFHWMAFLVLLSPVGTLAAFIVDDSSKSASTCEPFLIQWQGGIEVYILSANCGSSADPFDPRILEASSESVLENLGTLQVTAFKWSVDLAAGTAVLIELQDSTGAVAHSKPLDIQPGYGMHTKEYYDSTISGYYDSTISDYYDSTISDFYDSTIIDYFSADNNDPNVVVKRCFSANNQPVQSKSTKSAAGPYYAEPPAEAVSTLKTPSHIGIILGTAIPLALLLLFICVFLWRRYRKRTTADHEKLPVVGSGAPTWYMQPAYGFRHSQVTGSAPVASEPDHVPHAPPGPPPNPIVSQSDASSDSISRLSLPSQPSFVQSQGVSVPEYSSSTTPWTSGGLMEMPPSPSEYPSPPPAY
ncbi:hypothetical protein GGX14DRAFT_605545 [Mycena pura]|uniref:Uncharacterized protein n=1 Tax=Mycena pura TaxID=153505 RepID=A0AAD6VLM7_9AGAR|nr:hypothetical protein GGX14DRAFT_605545 [Mycena pura]